MSDYVHVKDYCFSWNWPVACAVPLVSFSRKLPLKEENGKDSLKPDTIEIKVHGDNSLHTTPDDSKA